MQTTLLELRRFSVRPALGYAASTLLLACLLVLPIIASLSVQRTILVWTFVTILDWMRLVFGLGRAQREFERGWLVRVHRSLRVRRAGPALELQVDDLAWPAERVRAVGIQEVAVKQGTYLRVFLLLRDCVILAGDGMNQERARAVSIRLADALDLPDEPCLLCLPTRFGYALLWTAVRALATLAVMHPLVSYPGIGSAFIALATTTLLDSMCVAQGKRMQFEAASEAQSMGIIDELPDTREEEHV